MPPAAARLSSRRRFLIALVTLTILLSGFLAFGRLPVYLLPAQETPRLRVTVLLPGVTAPVIEEKITRRLEQALTGITGVTGIESVTTSGNAVIDLSLRHRREIMSAQQDLTARLERVKSFWPAAAEPPRVSVIDASSVVEEFAVTSRDGDLLALRDWARDGFAAKLRELAGVATIEMHGGAVREILVQPDQRRLAGYGLSFGDLLQAIQKGPETNVPIRRPSARGRGRHVPMLSGGAAAVAALPVMLPDGEAVALSEVAAIALNEDAQPDHFLFEGGEAVKLTVHRQPSAAASDVSERIQSHLEWMRANRLIPEGIGIHPLSERFTQARHVLRQIALALTAGFVLVLCVAYLLLGSARRCVILGVVIAVSLQAVFVAMALSRLTLDVMTLGGLALGVGLFGSGAMMLFDSAPRAAGDTAISCRSVIAAALVLPATLLPVLFTGGEPALPFREFVFVFGGAWLISALIAPLLILAFDKRVRGGSFPRHALVGHAIISLRHSYTRGLSAALRRPMLVITVASLVLAGLVTAAFAFEKRVGKVSDGIGTVTARIQGPDVERLTVVADEAAQHLRSMTEWRDVRHSLQALHLEPHLRLDENRARELGIDDVDAGRALAIALTGIPAGELRDAEHRYDIRLRLPPEESGSDVTLGRLLLLGELKDRPAVHLRDVAVIETVSAPEQIRRRDEMPVVEITAVPASNIAPEQAWVRLRGTLRDFKLPAGYRLSYPAYTSPDEMWSRAFTLFGFALLILFVAQILLHRSLRAAILITFTAFLTLVVTGAVLRIFGMTLSPSLCLGGLILVGVTAGQVSLFVASAADRNGQSQRQMLRRIAADRFRPLLAVTFVALSGMMPLLFVAGAATVLHPVIIAIATGLLLSLPVNLFLFPSLYLLFERKEQSPGT